MTLSVLVSVGTHEQPFQRLLDEVRVMVIQNPSVKWTVQYGVGQWREVRGIPAADYLSFDEMATAVHDADVLISQASPGNVFGALAAHTWPIIVGRTVRNREHVDDHQLDFARHANTLDIATGLETVGELSSALGVEARWDRRARTERCIGALAGSLDATRKFRDAFWAQMDLIDIQPRRP